MQWLDKVKGFREIGVYLMMGLLVLSYLMGLVRLVSDSYLTLAEKSAWAYSNFLAPLAVVVLVLLVLSLATQQPVSPRANVLALISAIVVTLGVALAFIFGLIAFGVDNERGMHFLRWISNMIIPAAGAVVLFFIWAGTKPAPAYQHPQQYPTQGAPGYQQPGAPAPGQMPGQPGQPGPGQQPTWAPDQASGGAWQTAGQAASGASATEWGQPGQQQGWGQTSAMSATEHTGPIHHDPAQQGGWGQPSATEHTGPIHPDPQQAQPGNQWQAVDPNQQQGGHQ